jgi:putative transferase (TIGR04331 family)
MDQYMHDLLVTSSIKECCIPEKNIIFLGGWCVPFENLDSFHANNKFAKPFGPNLKSVKNLSDYSGKLYAQLLFHLTLELNKLHSEDNSEREWEIIIGHWLMRYIRALINRYKTIEQFLITNSAFETVELIYPDKEHLCPPVDSGEAIKKFRDPHFNYELYLEVLKRLDSNQIKFIQINYNFKNIKGECNIPKNSFGKKILKNINLFLSNISSNHDRVFILNPYLEKSEEFKLHIKLRQIPKIFRHSTRTPTKNHNTDIRKNLNLDPVTFQGNDHIDLTNYITKNIFRDIPMSYLENYKLIKNTVENNSFLKNPEWIITANNFDTDDIFKVWLSDKLKNNNAKYIAIQHGGGYGSSEILNSLSIEEKTSDYFVTWGWKKSSKNLPIGIFNNQKKRKIKLNIKNRLLIVMAVEREKVFIHDVNYEFNKNFIHLLEFYKNLSTSIKNSSIFRLSPNYKDKDLREDLQLKTHFPDVNIDEGVKNIMNLYAEARLVVQTVNSTSFLETLALNIPTIGVFDEDFVDINRFSEQYFEVLKVAGLIFFNVNDAAKFINATYCSIDDWWLSPKVQHARVHFVNMFAKDDDRVNGLLNIINES